MMHTFIGYQKYRVYTETPRCIVTGQGFYKDRLYQEKKLHALVSSWHTEEDFTAGVQALNGFYALICRTANQLFAAVDRVRSIPLFYGQKGNDFYLSDSADWVCEKVGNKGMDPVAKEELLLTGYVTGPDTLFSDVKQLQAGEMLIVNNNTRIQVKTERYYRFIHDAAKKAGIDELMAQHDQILLRVFKRLTEIANGRTLVVPLSGGYDSRLIVLMLKRLGYKNVITFTYGRPGNKESEVSRKVAGFLDLRWEFVSYSNEDWYKWYNSSERKAYSRMAGNLCSLPHLQDWPAVWQLKQKEIVPEDSIFVPGHTGDFISGGHIPVQFKKIKFIDSNTLVDAIWSKHYILHNLNYSWKNNKIVFRKRIGNLCEHKFPLDIPKAASTFEKWEWQERQAKFIINSARVYEYWGYDWWMPFWDYDYMHFWSSIPLKFRIKQTMYNCFVDNVFYAITAHTLPRDDLNPSWAGRLRRAIGPYIHRMVKDKLKKIAPISEYHSHPLAIWGIFSIDEYLNLRKTCKNTNSAGTLAFLKAVNEQYDLSE